MRFTNRNWGFVVGVLLGWVGLFSGPLAAQPDEVEGAPAAQEDQRLERMIRWAERMGRQDLAEGLRSEDPKVRELAQQQMFAEVFRRQAGREGDQQRVAELARRQAGREGDQPRRRPPQEGPQGFWGGPFAGGLMPGLATAPAMTVQGESLFILRGETLYEVDVNTLQLRRTVSLAPPAARPRVVRSYALAQAQAPVVAKVLLAVYQEPGAVTVVPVPPTNRIIVRAPQEQLEEIETLIKELDVPEMAAAE